MAMILPFRPDVRAGRAQVRRTEARRAPAEVIIFPGVRIEREGAQTPPADDLGSGKTQKADAVRKH